MEILDQEKVIIVEGTSDKRKVKTIVKEPIDIICTNGTISITRLDEWIDTLFDKDVYILVDTDESGEKLRKQLKREFPLATHLYIDKMYREVASAPKYHLATILLGADIEIYTEYLDRG
ncbi:hypothetical protein JMM81_11695 [Bacillus sp. V3B]|uniref:toprim domain-containing protein n=1 Tax=Bacillus sp. V3B TaxID=2804915 RepID=UPI0021091F45|nr:toprim domain-containing protein [Bacillus sp. V3B]MCQ6275621.1 hypothetical protein [Bacillus sp. V3B]